MRDLAEEDRRPRLKQAAIFRGKPAFVAGFSLTDKLVSRQIWNRRWQWRGKRQVRESAKQLLHRLTPSGHCWTSEFFSCNYLSEFNFQSLSVTCITEADTDMDLMLSCLEEASEDVIIQALQTISTMCNNRSKSRIMQPAAYAKLLIGTECHCIIKQLTWMQMFILPIPFIPGAQSLFQRKGGVNRIWSLLKRTKQSSVRQCALFSLGCAVERNGQCTFWSSTGLLCSLFCPPFCWLWHEAVIGLWYKWHASQDFET